MKKLTNFITNISAKVYSNTALRILFYLLVILALLFIYLLTDGAKIEFVYNDF